MCYVECPNLELTASLRKTLCVDLCLSCGVVFPWYVFISVRGQLVCGMIPDCRQCLNHGFGRRRLRWRLLGPNATRVLGKTMRLKLRSPQLVWVVVCCLLQSRRSWVLCGELGLRRPAALFRLLIVIFSCTSEMIATWFW